MNLIRGISFGLVTGIITALGVITGLFYSNSSSNIVILSVLLLAISDGLAESYGMYNSLDKSTKEEHIKTIQNSVLLFLTKFSVSMLLVFPFLFTYRNKQLPIIISIFLAFLFIIVLSFYKYDNNDKLINTIINIVMLCIICMITFFIGNINMKYK